MLASDLGGLVPLYDDAAFEAEMARRELEFQRLRVALLDGPAYRGLVTRDFLAHERALYERVLVAEPELLRAEARARMAIASAESAVVSSQLAPRARRLETTAAAVSAGEGEPLIHKMLLASGGAMHPTWDADTAERCQLLLRCGGAVIVGAEGGERVSRAALIADEAAMFAQLTDPRYLSDCAGAAFAAQQAREAAETEARAVVHDAERNARRDGVMSEGKARAAIQFECAREHHELLLRLQWRVQNVEAGVRWDIEAEEKEAWNELTPQLAAVEAALVALIAAADAERAQRAAARLAAGTVEGLCAALFASAPVASTLRLVNLHDGAASSTAALRAGDNAGPPLSDGPEAGDSPANTPEVTCSSGAAAPATASGDVHEAAASVAASSEPPEPPTATARLVAARQRIDSAWNLL